MSSFASWYRRLEKIEQRIPTPVNPQDKSVVLLPCKTGTERRVVEMAVCCIVFYQPGTIEAELERFACV